MQIRNSQMYQTSNKQPHVAKTRTQREKTMIDNQQMFDLLVFLKLISAPILGFLTVILRRAYQGKHKKWSVSIAEAGLVAIASYCIVPLLTALNMDTNLAYPFSCFIGILGIDRVSVLLAKWANDKFDKLDK